MAQATALQDTEDDLNVKESEVSRKQVYTA